MHGDTLAFLQYTSGSTGTPKGVMLTHANLMHNSALIAYAFEHTRSGSGVFWLPSYHDMGLIGGILQPLYIGQAERADVADVVLAEAVSLAAGHFALSLPRSAAGRTSPTTCASARSRPSRRATLDLSSWRLAFNGAEPVRAETIERFAKMFEPCGFRREAFYPCYGMAEATLIVSGGFKVAPPVVRSFDAKALENNQVLDAPADEDGARELVGCGGNLLDQRIVIADPHTLTPAAGRPGGRDLGRRARAWPRAIGSGREETEHTFQRPSGRHAAKGPSCAPAIWAFSRTASCSSPAGSKT